MTRKMMTFFILFATAICFSADQSFTVENYGRRIQLDGFLMEWNAKSAHTLKDNNNSTWHFDLINTFEGLAGYIRSDSSVHCSTWLFTFDPYSDVNTIQIKIPGDRDNLYKYDKKLYDSLGIVVLEWLIPWEQIRPDSTGAYAFLFKCVSDCGDSLPSLLINGTKIEKKATFNAALIIRTILILLLIIIYIVLNIKLRNRAKKRKMINKKSS